MNDDTIADLKQFIAATVTQEISGVHEDIAALKTDMQNMERRLATRIDDLERSVADALDTSNDAANAQLQSHERRVNLLEHKATA